MLIAIPDPRKVSSKCNDLKIKLPRLQEDKSTNKIKIIKINLKQQQKHRLGISLIFYIVPCCLYVLNQNQSLYNPEVKSMGRERESS